MQEACNGRSPKIRRALNLATVIALLVSVPGSLVSEIVLTF
jgi:hypothetical protein